MVTSGCPGSALLSFVLVMLLPLALAGVSQERKSILPLSSDEIQEYVQSVQETISSAVSAQLAIPDRDKTPENTMRPWSRFANDLLGRMATLYYLAQTQLPAAADAAKGMEQCLGQLGYSIMLNPDLHRSFLAYAGEALHGGQTLSPYEYYEVHSLLEGADTLKDYLSDDARETVESLKATSAARHRLPYRYFEGTDQTPSSKPGTLTVLSLNTCFAPGTTTYLHGGLPSWEHRVAALADKILQVDADVVCLQEVHPEDASDALYQRLKDRYSYIYAAIGPRPLGLSFQNFGLSSGLFVASKYPLENPRFTLFDTAGYPMNWGIFHVAVMDGSSQPIAHIYTTHLQSLREETFAEIRAAQLQQAVQQMEADYLAANTKEAPRLLCGDFNIPWGSGEPGEKIIRAYFHDAHNNERAEVPRHEATWDDYFTTHFFHSQNIPIAIPDQYGILDYSLLLKSLPSAPDGVIGENVRVETVLVPMHDRGLPQAAVSDHHGLLTTLRTDFGAPQ